MTRRRFEGPATGSECERESRLSNQLIRIRDLMLDGRWRTLPHIHEVTGEPEASVSAQLRHLRKTRFGGYRVEKRHTDRGLWEYRVLPPAPAEQLRLPA